MLKRSNHVNHAAAIVASLAVACLVSVTGSAQRRITSPDGHAATEIRGHYEGAEEPVYVGGKWIEISYGRPIKRGRDLWESGASYGKRLNTGAPVWRAGADISTYLMSELPLVINEKNASLPVLDSTRLLARAALARAVSGIGVSAWR